MHWTQDPKNKAKLKKIRQRGMATRAANRRAGTTQTGSGATKRGGMVISTISPSNPVEMYSHEPQSELVHFLAGYSKGWLEAQAERAGIPASAPTFRVGKILQATARR